ncbi:MAG TPA: PocR ligand-binding domain-containing protein, partial [Candidatus Margulisiibacteriota bacterium]|nr:PocR ligand-binding domain-containing protein [Candidatus Margulisiibacteriota bacterium]
MLGKNNITRTLEELIDVNEWQKIQDNFSAITGISVRILDLKCSAVIKPSRQPSLCADRPAICGECLPTFLGGKWSVDKNLSYSCHFGLHNFMAPLRIEGQVMGYLIIGPVILVMRKPKEEYRKAAEELNMDLDDFWNAISEIKVISFHGAQSLVELIKDVFEYLLKMSYQSLMIKKDLLLNDSPKMVRLLNALLDVAFQVSGADVGSIMFLDKIKNELSIKASRGLSEDVVTNSRVKLGEGISGMAAKEGEAFIIDDTFKDNRLKNFLNRSYISSSMVVPLKVEDSV